MDHEVIGEGSYGCVVYPSLPCKSKAANKKIEPTLNVSKIMLDKHAKEEQKEVQFLESISGIDEYVLGVPLRCKPRLDETFFENADKCENDKILNVLDFDPKALSMLVYENAGIDLVKYIRSSDIFTSSSDNDKNIFLTSILKLMEGIAFFQKNDIIHCDIKMGNIVYNAKTGDIKFIDFGLMLKYSEFIKLSKESKNYRGKSHSYWPPEASCINKKPFFDRSKCEEYKIDYAKDYDYFLKQATKSFDVYCFCFAMKKMFRYLLTNKCYVSKKGFLLNCYRLMEKGCYNDIVIREIDINVLKREYKELLESANIINTSKPSPDRTLSLKIEKFSLDFDISHIIKTCNSKALPVYNPIKQKCVQACKTGKVRNDNFRCVNKTTKNKNKKNNIELEKNEKMKECNDKNKDYNPITRRCNAKCKPNEVRNIKFKCVKNKTIRNSKVGGFPKKKKQKRSVKSIRSIRSIKNK